MWRETFDTLEDALIESFYAHDSIECNSMYFLMKIKFRIKKISKLYLYDYLTRLKRITCEILDAKRKAIDFCNAIKNQYRDVSVFRFAEIYHHRTISRFDSKYIVRSDHDEIKKFCQKWSYEHFVNKIRLRKFILIFIRYKFTLVKCEMSCIDMILIHNYTKISKWEANTWESAETYVEDLISRMRQDEIRF